MKKLLLVFLVIVATISVACTSATPSETADSSPKKLSLEDAPDILDLSTLLPVRFEELDSTSEGLSNADMELGPDFSEVQLYLSNDPFQMIYCFIGIVTSKIESASFDTMIQDEEQMKKLISENIIAGAKSEGADITVPDIVISHPDIGDTSVLGEGLIENSGFYFGFDTCWFRNKSAYVFIYSLYMSEDKIAIDTISDRVNGRLANYSQ